MTWTELIRAVARNAGITEAEARSTLNSMVQVITDSLLAGDDVVLKSICIINSRWRAARTVRSVASRRKLLLDGRFVPRFRPSRILRAALAARPAQDWNGEKSDAANGAVAPSSTGDARRAMGV